VYSHVYAFPCVDRLDRDQDKDLWRDLNQASGSHSTRLKPAEMAFSAETVLGVSRLSLL
jgi:hypothetical protein